jgi:hypothetical protein
MGPPRDNAGPLRDLISDPEALTGQQLKDGLNSQIPVRPARMRPQASGSMRDACITTRTAVGPATSAGQPGRQGDYLQPRCRNLPGERPPEHAKHVDRHVTQPLCPSDSPGAVVANAQWLGLGVARPTHTDAGEGET